MSTTKRLSRRLLATLLCLTLIFSIAPITALATKGGVTHEAGESGASLSSLDEFRKWFFGQRNSEIRSFSAEPDVIYIDSSDIIHVPQEYIEPTAGGIQAAASPVAAAPELSDTRSFSVNAKSTGTVSIDFTLVMQGTYVNLWLPDHDEYHTAMGTTHGDDAQCAISDMSEAQLTSIANTVDGIYNNMTAAFGEHSSVTVENIPFSNLTQVGDVDKDGRINLVMYNINGKDGSSSVYTAGYFFNGDFFVDSNELDMLHIDIATSYGYNNLTTDSSSFYNTIAHEFQHMLFYMYFGVYIPNYSSGGTDYYYASHYKWLNESLSELAGMYYSVPGYLIVNISRLIYAAENSYQNGSAYGDFLNFNNSLKNYGMGTLFSILMRQANSSYEKGMYDYFKYFVPPTAGFKVNEGKFSSTNMPEILGNAFNAAGLTGTLTGGIAFINLYIVFMEYFAADGGTIVDGVFSYQTEKFIPSNFSAYNLWGIRPALGATADSTKYTHGVFWDDSGYYYSLADYYTAIPPIASGNLVTLNGYGSVDGAYNPTHEMLYKLVGETDASPVLSITVGAQGETNTMYYVVVADKSDTTINLQRGMNGAAVYPLTAGVEKEIDTGGKPAYLFAVTLWQQVNTTVTYDWAAPPPKTMSVGAQNGTLTEGTAGSATFTVTTANIANNSTITLNNTNSVAGITLNTTNTTNDSTTITISTTAATPQGTHPLTLTIDGVTSTVFTLTVVLSTPIDIAVISGVTAPVYGATPVTAITETAQYTGTVSWAPAVTPFQASTIYTATITLTPKAGYTLTGLSANFFTVAGASSVTNSADSGVITAVFPATLSGSTSTGGGGGGTPTPPTVPAADGAVSVDYSQSGGTVTLDMPSAKVDEIINKSVDGTATLDLSGISGATNAAIPASALTQFAGEGLDVEIKLPQGTVTLDAGAAASAAEQAGGSITVSLIEIAHDALTPVQQDAIGAGDTVVDITMKSGNTVISSFDGTITVTVPYTGELPAAVWYLNDAGELEKLNCTYDAKTGTVTFTTDHLSLYVVGKDENPFTDVRESDWFYDDVMFVYSEGLMNGTGGSLFSPQTPITRGMIVTILYRAEGSSDVSGLENPFGDVAAGLWYTDAVKWAADNDIVSGYGDGRFGPDDNITRQDLAVILWRYAQYAGIDVSVGENTNILSYNDAFDVAEYAIPAMQWASGAGIISGKPGGLLDPRGTASRAEAAATLHRLLK